MSIQKKADRSANNVTPEMTRHTVMLSVWSNPTITRRLTTSKQSDRLAVMTLRRFLRALTVTVIMTVANNPRVEAAQHIIVRRDLIRSLASRLETSISTAKFVR